MFSGDTEKDQWHDICSSDQSVLRKIVGTAVLELYLSVNFGQYIFKAFLGLHMR